MLKGQKSRSLAGQTRTLVSRRKRTGSCTSVITRSTAVVRNRTLSAEEAEGQGGEARGSRGPGQAKATPPARPLPRTFRRLLVHDLEVGRLGAPAPGDDVRLPVRALAHRLLRPRRARSGPGLPGCSRRALRWPLAGLSVTSRPGRRARRWTSQYGRGGGAAQQSARGRSQQKRPGGTFWRGWERPLPPGSLAVGQGHSGAGRGQEAAATGRACERTQAALTRSRRCMSLLCTSLPGLRRRPKHLQDKQSLSHSPPQAGGSGLPAQHGKAASSRDPSPARAERHPVCGGVLLAFQSRTQS